MAASKVLVIEDNEMNMELALALLEKAGCIAIQATSAEAGIQLATTQAPHLVLMDLNLPGMDGLSAVRILKQNPMTGHIPVVVMTAHAMQGDEQKAREAGSDGYLTKPINIREFLEVIAKFTANADQAAAPSPPATVSHHLLVVDDDQSNCDLLDGLLRSLGHSCECVSSGAEALQRLRDPELATLDLVLLDVMMPGMNGFEVARHMRADPTLHDLPIVMTTALTSREDRLLAVEAGANDFITKPIDKTELRVRVTSLLKMKVAQDALRNHRAELETLVEQRTSALQSALNQVEAARREADTAHLDTIYRLAAASEFKDKDTATHIQRVSNYCSLLARHLGLPEDEIEVLRIASPMHDVGKLGIADSILLKHSRLDPNEWAIMQTHTTIGARILSGSSSHLLQAGEIIALSHHEKWDGSGYPQGLAGAAIPLWGRICAIADVFDALTSERPYKAALSNDQAFEIMAEQRARHFDPDLLDIFLQACAEVVAIKDNNTSSHKRQG
jgi:putative two-component system response regulator